MSIRDARRSAAIERMADHLLETGLGAARLRTLAGAAGISDRMLLYYFDDKDDVLAATLEHVAARLAATLDAAVPAGTRLNEAALRRAVWQGMTSPAIAPYCRVWLELAAGASRGEQPHRDVAGRIADLFLGWLTARLDAPVDRLPAAAARLFAWLEGAMLLDALGRPDMAMAAIAAD